MLSSLGPLPARAGRASHARSSPPGPACRRPEDTPWEDLRYIAGEIERVHTLGNNVARPKEPGFTIEDTFISTIRFASGASGHHVHSWATPWGTSGFAVNGPDFHLNLRLSGPPSVYGTIGDPNGDGTPVRDDFTQPAGGSRGSKSC